MDSGGWQQLFSVTVTANGDGAVVSLKGELDLSGVEDARQAVDQAEQAGGKLLVIDMSELTFIDSTGLEIVLRAARRAQESGRRLVVRKPSAYVKRLLELTAIDQSLDIVDDVV